MELSILLMEQIAKLFIMIFMGYAVVKMGLLKDEDSKVLSTLVLYLIVPCVILNAFQVDYTPEKVSGLELACIASLLLLFILLPIVNLIGNIVFSVAGSVGDGVASKAKEEGKLAIQVDANKDDQQPGYVLTSVIKNTEVPVYDIVKEAVNGKIDKMDRAQTYSLASGAASITDLSEISKHIQDSGKDKWEEIKTEIKDVEDKISDGTIVVTDAQSGEEFDASKCPNVTVK